jgi:proteasome lid subunit RPN8/RPN11
MPQTRARPALYQYRLEFFKVRGGERVHELRLARADFDRAIEAAFFGAMRRGQFTEYNPPLAMARIEPAFGDNNDGSPNAPGFLVVLPLPGGGEHRQGFPAEFFDRRATRIGADLVRAKRVPNGSTLLYQLSAYLEGEEQPARPGLRFTLESESVAVPIRPGSLSGYGPREAWDDPQPGEMPVLIPRRVIDEAVEEAERAPEREVGGALLGHLRRDTASGEIFVEVTCQVPAEETTATEVSVTFTPETWARVREVIEVRGAGEIFVGWVHSHPFGLCDECPAKPPPECVGKVLFFSEDDEFLMELSFPRPFMVGLLSAREPRLRAALGHAPVRLFGWRDGEIVPRGFEVIED